MRRIVPLPFPTDPLAMSAKDLGRFARAARTQSDLPLEAPALALGVSKQTLQNLETGKATVGLGIALRILEGLGVALFAQPAQFKERARRRLLEVSDAP